MSQGVQAIGWHRWGPRAANGRRHRQQVPRLLAVLINRHSLYYTAPTSQYGIR